VQLGLRLERQSSIQSNAASVVLPRHVEEAVYDDDEQVTR
jgi:hypothetical protein